MSHVIFLFFPLTFFTLFPCLQQSSFSRALLSAGRWKWRDRRVACFLPPHAPLSSSSSWFLKLAFKGFLFSSLPPALHPTTVLRSILQKVGGTGYAVCILDLVNGWKFCPKRWGTPWSSWCSEKSHQNVYKYYQTMNDFRSLILCGLMKRKWQNKEEIRVCTYLPEIDTRKFLSRNKNKCIVKYSARKHCTLSGATAD